MHFKSTPFLTLGHKNVEPVVNEITLRQEYKNMSTISTLSTVLNFMGVVSYEAKNVVIYFLKCRLFSQYNKSYALQVIKL